MLKIINTGDPTPDYRGKVKVSLDGPVDGGRGAGVGRLRTRRAG